MGKTKDVSHQELMEVINSFDFGGKLEEVGIFGNGHINETYCDLGNSVKGLLAGIRQIIQNYYVITGILKFYNCMASNVSCTACY